MRLMVKERFLKAENLDLLHIESSAEKLLYHFDRPSSLI
jgi:hypothetical protein